MLMIDSKIYEKTLAAVFVIICAVVSLILFPQFSIVIFRFYSYESHYTSFS